MIPRLLRRSDWRWLWAVTLLSTTALLVLVTLLACSNGSNNTPTETTITAGPTPGSIVVYLAWNSHPEIVSGYRVYFGPALDPVSVMRVIADITATEASLDWQHDLGGVSPVCFRISAYNADGESALTDGVCVTP